MTHSGRIIDLFFFIIATLAATVLAIDVFRASFSARLLHLLLLLPFWGIVAYLVLPRIHTLLTAIYVPNYFIGRARTSDGLLGDPINLAFDGSAREIHTAMTKAGWRLADDITMRSSLGIIRSALLRKSYPHAPVSPLLVFGRKQCFAYQQEVDGNASQRHHVRFWRCPDGWFLPGGIRADWLAAGTYDRAVGLSLFTLQITHKVDANIDVERDYIVNCLEGSDARIQHRVIENFSTGYHSRNGGGDEVRTDGNLPVVDLTGVIPDQDFDQMPWAVVRAACGYPDLGDPAAGAAASPDSDLHEVLRSSGAKEDGDRRPNSVIAGVFLAFVAVFFDVIIDVQAVERLTAEIDPVLGGIVQILRGVSYVGLLICAWRTWRGSGSSRIWLLGFALFNLLADGVIFKAMGEQLDAVLPVAAICVNIVLLLALSEDSARIWSTRRGVCSKAPSREGPVW
ncbi:LssY C-terminal domain-containing protein [Corynebacterium sp. CCM 9203]|uniref:LssY C-terminal domain-containing protein n=1 Tax=Corynebacterium sp. CCM 9203 TaxID=3057615 RepID=UPI0035241B82